MLCYGSTLCGTITILEIKSRVQEVFISRLLENVLQVVLSKPIRTTQIILQKPERLF